MPGVAAEKKTLSFYLSVINIIHVHCGKEIEKERNKEEYFKKSFAVSESSLPQPKPVGDTLAVITSHFPQKDTSSMG